ncbi:hypothetical protein TanjilG_00286 [Lupinus angustifolius]|uniref:Uncharacterized protein n=1 Tax=Lupinus angustifolius TaxID=3871 RepID=A0A4P1QQD4_LUPAN|nr:PREDICTED: uncharacterized protein LOC109333725 [Lupinus angustifolius]OIV92268.1 hypothetical protein TanjilG_00286 [Lupinus angustifolius]
MSNKIVLRQATSSNHRLHQLLQTQPSKHHVGEVVGGTAAECVAVCCCCPCGLVNFLILTVYKLPAGICRRMLKTRRRKRLIKEGRFPPIKRGHCSCSYCDINGLRIHPMCANDAFDIKTLHSLEPDDKDAMALEKEMWDKFYSTGFWRSSSRRESSTQTAPNNMVLVHNPHLIITPSTCA